jgi:hypothetical protein
VRAAAQWCTLCFADLRPRAEPLAEVAPQPQLAELAPQPQLAELAPQPQPAVAFDPLTAPLALLERGGVAVERVEPAEPADATDPEGPVPAKLAGWPCMTCGDVVGIELSACPTCGAGFMMAAPGQTASGGLGVLSAGATDKKLQLRIMIGGAGLLCVVILIVLFVVGAFF